MDDNGFDRALIAGAFAVAARDGWDAVSVAVAAREAGLALEQARARFPGRDAILMRFGRLADQIALADAPAEGSPRERLFELLMRRFDALQDHRDGVRALLRALPSRPPLALLLAAATNFSMVWMLEAAGISSHGLGGLARAKGLMAVWLYALRAWDRDDSADLSGTMAALDRALTRAETIGTWLGGRDGATGPKPFPDVTGDAAPPEAAAPA